MLVTAGTERSEHPWMAADHGLEVFVSLSPSLRGKCHVFRFENKKLFYTHHQEYISVCYSKSVFLTYRPNHLCPHMNLIRFNKVKYTALHLGQGSTQYQYCLGE